MYSTSYVHQFPKWVCFHSEEEITKKTSSCSEHHIFINVHSEENVCTCHLKEVHCILALIYNFLGLNCKDLYNVKL